MCHMLEMVTNFMILNKYLITMNSLYIRPSEIRQTFRAAEKELCWHVTRFRISKPLNTVLSATRKGD